VTAKGENRGKEVVDDETRGHCKGHSSGEADLAYVQQAREAARTLQEDFGPGEHFVCMQQVREHCSGGAELTCVRSRRGASKAALQEDIALGGQILYSLVLCALIEQRSITCSYIVL